MKRCRTETFSLHLNEVTFRCSLPPAPRIITLLETLDVLTDHNATFICEVESRPPADVTWTKNNHPIMYVHPETSSRSSNVQKLKETAKRQAGHASAMLAPC